MKVLLDEDIPVKLREHLTDHDVFTVAYLGLKGVRNGNLMRHAESEGFDILLTRDTGLGHQRPREVQRLALILVRIGHGKLPDLLPHLERIRSAISVAQPGSVTQIVEP